MVAPVSGKHSISFNVAPKPCVFSLRVTVGNAGGDGSAGDCSGDRRYHTRHLSPRGNLPLVPCRVITFVCDTLPKREDTAPIDASGQAEPNFQKRVPDPSDRAWFRRNDGSPP
jgi:hypothetical protein